MREIGKKKSEAERFLKSANEAALESRRRYRRTELLSARCAKLIKQKQDMGCEDERLAQLWQLLEEERLRELEATRLEMRRYREVECLIDQIEDAACRAILRRRFLEVGLTWVQIQQKLACDGMYYSERQLFRLYKVALGKAQDLWERQHGTQQERGECRNIVKNFFEGGETGAKEAREECFSR